MKFRLNELDYIKAWVCSGVCWAVGTAVLSMIVATIASIYANATLEPYLVDILFVMGGVIGAGVSYASFRLCVGFFIARKLMRAANGAEQQTAA